jgi:hypothetical protein
VSPPSSWRRARAAAHAPWRPIERYRIAERDFGGVLTEQGKLEKELPEHRRQSDIRPPCDLDTVVETDDPRWIAVERVAASEKESECADALLEVRPNTLAGLTSLLRYADSCDAGRDWPDCIASTAAEALEQIVGADAAAAKALVAPTPGEPVEEADPGVTKFGSAYQEWLEALAVEARLNAGGYAGADDPDGAIDAVSSGSKPPSASWSSRRPPGSTGWPAASGIFNRRRPGAGAFVISIRLIRKPYRALGGWPRFGGIDGPIACAPISRRSSITG